jgi:hypothetical protein
LGVPLSTVTTVNLIFLTRRLGNQLFMSLRAFAAGTVPFHSPELGWMGDARVTPMGDAVIGVAGAAFDWLGFAVSPATGAVAASVRLPGAILLNLEASHSPNR